MVKLFPWCVLFVQRIDKRSSAISVQVTSHCRCPRVYVINTGTDHWKRSLEEFRSQIRPANNCNKVIVALHLVYCRCTTLASTNHFTSAACTANRPIKCRIAVRHTNDGCTSCRHYRQCCIQYTVIQMAIWRENGRPHG